MQPIVSIIVPCYNQSLYLHKAIESLQTQTMPEWECIIVDDGSTDNSVEIAMNMALNDPRICVLQKINGGSATARNMGLKQVHGEYIQFLDADDSMDSEKLARQVAQMEQRGSDISYTAYCYSYADGSESAIRFADLHGLTILIRWGLGSSIPPHAFLYSAGFIQKHHYLQRLHYHQKGIYFVPSARVYHDREGIPAKKPSKQSIYQNLILRAVDIRYNRFRCLLHRWRYALGVIHTACADHRPADMLYYCQALCRYHTMHAEIRANRKTLKETHPHWIE